MLPLQQQRLQRSGERTDIAATPDSSAVSQLSTHTHRHRGEDNTELTARFLKKKKKKENYDQTIRFMSTYMFRLVCVWASVHTVDKYVYCFFSFYSISPSVLPLLSGILLRNAFFLQGTFDFFLTRYLNPVVWLHFSLSSVCTFWVSYESFYCFVIILPNCYCKPLKSVTWNCFASKQNETNEDTPHQTFYHATARLVFVLMCEPISSQDRRWQRRCAVIH